MKGVLMMKKIFLALLFMSCFAAFTAGAFALEPITIRDGNTGNTEDLYPIPDEEELLFYGNERFGYSVNIPHKVLTEVVLLPDSGDGMILESKDGKAAFRVSGGFLTRKAGDTLFESYAETLRRVGGVENTIHHDAGDDYWEISWRNGNTLHMRRFLLNGEEAWSDLEMHYEWDEGAGDDSLHSIMWRSFISLTFGAG